jgi:tRNA-2-methylthio-N6-dimethylallyladenosine synthase
MVPMIHPGPDAPRRVFLHTLGCQMNQIDSERTLSLLRRAGYAPTEDPGEADVILINTCSVREHAEDKAFSLAGQYARHLNGRGGILGIIGCMAERDGAEIFRRAPQVDLVVGPSQLGRLPELLQSARRERRLTALGHEGIHRDFVRIPSHRPTRHTAFVEVANGCDHACTFCVVPRVRGAEISRPMEEIVGEVKTLAEDGCREITLLGQTVNAYGRSLGPGVRFSDLLYRLNDVDGIERIRFVTSHPSHMHPDLVEAMRDLPKVCEQVHLPVQSGSDRMLLAMRRGYRVDRYRDILKALREAVPEIELATDLIVGFPGETEKDFEETVRLTEEIRYAYAFIFKYSPRPGTEAHGMADDVPAEEKARRNQLLLELQRSISLEKNRADAGKTVEVLVEGPSKKDPRHLSGRTRANQIVVFDGPERLAGELVSVRIEEATALTLFGSVAGARGPTSPPPARTLETAPGR